MVKGKLPGPDHLLTPKSQLSNNVSTGVDKLYLVIQFFNNTRTKAEDWGKAFNPFMAEGHEMKFNPPKRRKNVTDHSSSDYKK